MTWHVFNVTPLVSSLYMYTVNKERLLAGVLSPAGSVREASSKLESLHVTRYEITNKIPNNGVVSVHFLFAYLESYKNNAPL